MQEVIPDRVKISPFLVFYLVVSMQVGIGVLGYQRIIVKYAGQDSWISVLIAGLFLHIITWMMYKIAETVDGDIVSAHQYIIGNIGGRLLSSIFIAYYFIFSLTVLLTYLEIIHVWMFPSLSTFWFTFALMLICIYIVYGGFRTVVGIAFFGITLPFYLFLTFGDTLKYAQFENILPIWRHSIKDLLLGAYQTSLTFIGFETILFFYPFIKDPKKSKKWAHLGLLFTTLLYTGFMLITIFYFSYDELQKSVWATLTMWKIVEFPFVERFEYIGIASWYLVILPNICIPIWISSRLLKRIVNLRQKKGVLLIAISILIAVLLFDTRDRINVLNNFTAKMGFTFTALYIPVLFICVMIKKKVKKQ